MVRITVIGLEGVKDVDFYANHHLVSDPSASGAVTDYTALSEWHDENVNGSVADEGDRRYPVAFKRGITFAATATIKAQLFDFGKFDWDDTERIIVRVTSSHNNIEVSSDVQNLAIGESSVSVTVTPRFDTQVEFLESFELQWEVSIDKGNTWKSVGTTTHPVYLTWDNPDINPIYHTVMHLGSAYGKNAADHSSASNVVAAIWDNFSDRNVKRVSMSESWQVVEGAAMIYWGAWTWEHREDGQALTTEELLVQADGKCAAWADLLTDVLAAQGIASQRKTIVPKPIAFADETYGIWIKNYNFNEDFGFDIPNFGRIYQVNGVTDAVGVAAQSNGNPWSKFADHEILVYGGKIYDPSYGGGPYDDLLAWEAASLAGVSFRVIIAQVPGDVVLKQTAGRQDTQFAS